MSFWSSAQRWLPWLWYHSWAPFPVPPHVSCLLWRWHQCSLWGQEAGLAACLPSWTSGWKTQREVSVLSIGGWNSCMSAWNCAGFLTWHGQPGRAGGCSCSQSQDRWSGFLCPWCFHQQCLPWSQPPHRSLGSGLLLRWRSSFCYISWLLWLQWGLHLLVASRLVNIS